jgi:hypothetical protein
MKLFLKKLQLKKRLHLLKVGKKYLKKYQLNF